VTTTDLREFARLVAEAIGSQRVGWFDVEGAARTSQAVSSRSDEERSSVTDHSAQRGRLVSAFSVDVSKDFFAQLEQRVAAIVIDRLGDRPPTRWLNVNQAANYLGGASSGAIRGMVKRGQLPVHRTPTGRLLFDAGELDTWVRGEPVTRTLDDLDA
jgi:hypothetical protein